MTPEEAIKILEDEATYQRRLVSFRTETAIKQGIEAIEREKKYRENHPDVAPHLLPGETLPEVIIVSDQPGESHLVVKGETKE